MSTRVAELGGKGGKRACNTRAAHFKTLGIRHSDVKSVLRGGTRESQKVFSSSDS